MDQNNVALYCTAKTVQKDSFRVSSIASATGYLTGIAQEPTYSLASSLRSDAQSRAYVSVKFSRIFAHYRIVALPPDSI